MSKMYINTQYIVAVEKVDDTALHIDCINKETYVYTYNTEKERDEMYGFIRTRFTNSAIFNSNALP